MNDVNTTKFLNERFGKYGTWVDKTFSKKLEI